MRKSLALVLSAGLLVSLAACSSPSTPDCAGAATSGAASDGIDVTGDFGAAPTVTFGSPVDATNVQRTIVTQGDGPETGVGGAALVTYTLFDAGTGQQLQGSNSDGATTTNVLTLDDKGIGVPGIVEGLTCVSAGSRVAVVIPSDSLSAEQQASFDGLVAVMDVQETYPRAATGGDVPAVAGFPSVVHDDTGRPGITIVSSTEPTEFRSTAIKKGDGAAVEDGDLLVVQYMAVDYDSKKVLTSTWENGNVSPYTVGSTQASSGQGLPASVDPAFDGAHVGDEIMALVPPADGSTGAATAYVIDILGIYPQDQ